MIVNPDYSCYKRRKFSYIQKDISFKNANSDSIKPPLKPRNENDGALREQFRVYRALKANPSSAKEADVLKVKLYQQNLRLVDYFAKAFQKTNGFRLDDIGREELIDYGRDSLMYCIENYNPDHESKATFSTYAYSYVNRGFVIFTNRKSSLKRGGNGRKGKFADRLNLNSRISLDAPLPRTDRLTVKDKIASISASPEGHVIKVEQLKKIRDILNSPKDWGIKPDFMKIIKACYFEDKNLSEIAEEQGVSRQAIAQIHKKGLEKLQVALKRRKGI